jgi:pimeloyl-ACP methyl ester carboxylesterase
MTSAEADTRQQTRRAVGDGRTPVLLVSPFPESLCAYDEFWTDMSQAAPLVALDLPGCRHTV